MTEKFFTSSSEFSIHIEKLALTNGIPYLEALSMFCEDTGAEYDEVAALISQSLRQKIYEEATKQYSMPKVTTTQLDVC
jgi:hypothetical protein